METRFLPAERDSGAQIAQQGKELSAVQLLTQLANAVPEVLMVLNDKRQIVFVNQQLLRLVSCRNPRDVYGARAGEVMRCIHARETDGGCGTTESCRHCGAALATAAALDGRDAVEECRLTREKGGEPLNLRVKTTPLDVQGRQYVVLSAADISHEKRRETLERVLFGEILEVSEGLKDRVADLKIASPEEAGLIGGAIARYADRLMEGVNEHRLLLVAERGQLHLRPSAFYTKELVGQLVEHYRGQKIAAERALELSADTRDTYMTSDRALLKQVLSHMIRNALEASAPHETVTVLTAPRDDRVEFRVHNPNPMDEAVQAQVFQRGFSTRGPGRGLGTYTMKLFSERYLQGKVKFTSTARVGTVFLASYPRELTG